MRNIHSRLFHLIFRDLLLPLLPKRLHFVNVISAWYGWNGKWNGMEISIWNMEDIGMEDFKNGM